MQQNQVDPIESPIRKALYSAEASVAFRNIFAVLLWHLDLIPDAMALASHLKFHPEQSRPTAPSSQVSELESFSKLRRIEPTVQLGTKVAFLNHGLESAVAYGSVIALKLPAVGRETVRVGMRLEAKDRQNPHMICESFHVLECFIHWLFF